MTTPKKKITSSPEPDTTNYLGVGVVFFAVGLSMLASEATRYAGLPFFILGLSFMAIAHRDSKKPENKHKK